MSTRRQFLTRAGSAGAAIILTPQAGGPFGADQTISDTRRNGLWPSIAITAAGDAIAAWVTNTDGSGGGAPAAAIHGAD